MLGSIEDAVEPNGEARIFFPTGSFFVCGGEGGVVGRNECAVWEYGSVGNGREGRTQTRCGREGREEDMKLANTGRRGLKRGYKGGKVRNGMFRRGRCSLLT